MSSASAVVMWNGFGAIGDTEKSSQLDSETDWWNSSQWLKVEGSIPIEYCCGGLY